LQAEGLLAVSSGQRPGEEVPPPNPVRDSMSIETGIMFNIGRGVGWVCTEAMDVPAAKVTHESRGNNYYLDGFYFVRI